MSESTKKQNFLHGAMLLAIATAVVKVIGALYKIPLKMIIGDQGYGYFTTAYDIYAVLLMISTAGLPVAMSRMISQASALGHYNRVRRIYKAAQGIFLGLGILSTVLMMGFATQLAGWLEQPNAKYAILFLGPCAFLMGIISTYRGFFQGQGDMRPTSVSQVLEAVFKLVVGLGAAFAIVYYTKSVPLAAGGAILGVTVSCAISVFYLLGKFRPAYRELPQTREEQISYGAAIKGLLAIAVPITVGSAGLQLLTVVEQKLYMSQLLGPVGMSQDAADTVKGIYSMSLTIFNMPCAFIIPITVSIIPAITSQLTLKNDAGVKATEESAARITGLLSLPCSVGLCLLARPVMALLGGYAGEKLDLATNLMATLGVCIFLYAIIQYTNALLQSHGYAHIPVINMLLAGGAKLVVVYILVGNPSLGILGAPLGAVLGYAAIGAMNLIAISKIVPQKPALLRNLLRPFLPVTLMGIVVFGVYWGLSRIITSRLLLCGVPIALGALVYCLAVVKCKAITAEDCKLLPKGETIAKFLRL
ncbi:MAG: polysaccharide biosynthesis protein [Oscillospiraceae bacterium]|nr:polysaccharide biosynthesis protein [Oscillospiraceae bacterium]